MLAQKTPSSALPILEVENRDSRVTQKKVSWKDSGSTFHDPSRAGTWISSTKSALAQVTRGQLAS